MKKLQEAYNPESFKKVGLQLIEQLFIHLKRVQAGEGKVIRYQDPKKSLEYWQNYKIKDVNEFFEDLISDSIHIHHPNYIGHQVAAPLPLIAAAGLVSDLLNNGMGVYEMGIAATTMEKIVIQEFCQHLGYKDQGDGFLTSGGTLGNLTALLAARAHMNLKSFDNQKNVVILVSEQAHYCADRAAATMGMSEAQVIKIAVDSNYRMDISSLKSTIKKLHDKGQTIMSIIASACTTATGSYDNLEAISVICKQHEIWMHVDGAHGAPVVFSKKYKHLIKGIENADSIVVDAHKMMMIPALATAVLFKRSSDSYNTFKQKADYLFAKKEPEWFNLAKRTYETTKFMISIKCFLLFKYYGTSLIEEYLDRQHDLTRKFANHIVSLEDWEIAHFPMSNILCFRYCPSSLSEKEIQLLNQYIRDALLHSGNYYIVSTNLSNKYYLRVTLMNHLTEFNRLEKLCTEIIRLSTSYEVI